MAVAEKKGKRQAESGENDDIFFPVEALSVPQPIRDFYLNSGIRSLYPPQSQAISAGLLDNKNVMISIPTASGKTLLAELAMLKSIESGGKALYIVPLRALASEKFRRFTEFRALGYETGISTGDLDLKDEYLGTNDIIVATSEKVDSLIRNETRWLSDISVVILDEVHLIDSPDRGPTLEIVITKLRRLNPKMQIIALSATIQNSKEVAQWLNASHVVSNWRPTKLYEGIYYDGVYCADVQTTGKSNNSEGSKLKNKDGTDAQTKTSPLEKKIIPVFIGREIDAAVSLVKDTLVDGGQCLVFESSRKNAVGFAKKAAPIISSLLTPLEKEELARIAFDIAEGSDTEAAAVLASCVRSGVSFHHAGLSAEQREIVEQSFLAGKIKMISSTPTLAAGLNLPARRVIIRSWKRYDANSGMQPIPVMEYKQMAGRAGRPHLDPYGEAVLIAAKEKDVELLTEKYIHSSPESIESKLGAENMLRTHVLSTLTNGFARNREQLIDFFKGTFFAHQHGLLSTISLTTVVDKCLDFLIENDMCREQKSEANKSETQKPETNKTEVKTPEKSKSAFQTADKLDPIEKKNSNSVYGNDSVLIPTTLGSTVSKLYIDPLSASVILEDVLKFKSGTKNLLEISPLGLLHLICKTTDMKLLYMKSGDYPWVSEFIADNAERFISIPDPVRVSEYEWFMGEVKTAVLLYRWISEVSENDISKEFDIGEGDLRNFSEIACWLSNAASRLCRLCGFSEESALFSDLELRLQYGASVDLLSLLKIRGIGRVRARKLYAAGFKSKDALKKSDYITVSGLVGPKIAEKIYRDIGLTMDAEELSRLKNTKTGHPKSPQNEKLRIGRIQADTDEIIPSEMDVDAVQFVRNEFDGASLSQQEEPDMKKSKKTQRRFDEFFD
ncbi:DEAD/DEAH box helicase [Methanolapillus ohkumae]|uniref:ATP-dependent DNA helicase Hel308 n=1 Tax=Methanolapillus ohkumae TaxID=3028298 RepID=A0AA96V515_9EURY|nr:hypothetical protein MsAm2_04850 [Methanosarcinaceae archaeon Am2]